MNQIRRIEKLNDQELESNTPFSASWHQDYQDTSYIYIGNLSKKLDEEDILTIFSQFGVPTNLKLMRDKKTGESLKFGFLKYEDFKSCVLAIDNLNGFEIIPGIHLRVDHVRYSPYVYVGDDDANIRYDEKVKQLLMEDMADDESEVEDEKKMIEDVDPELEDPMAAYFKDKEKESRRKENKEKSRTHRGHNSSSSKEESSGTRSKKHRSSSKPRDSDSKRRHHHSSTSHSHRHRSRHDSAKYEETK